MDKNIEVIANLENLIVELGINSIKRKGQVIFHENHFCTQNLSIIRETLAKLIKLKLDYGSYKTWT